MCALVIAELGFVVLHGFARQRFHRVLVVRQSDLGSPIEVFVRNIVRVDGKIHTHVLGFAGINHHGAVAR